MPKTYPVASIEYGSYRWLRREVGGFLGYGFAEGTWDPEQSGKVDSIVQSGLMQFYYPPPIPVEGGQTDPHRWSFLAPIDSLSLVSGTREYELPEDFSGVVGQITVASTTASGPMRLSLVEESRLRQLEQTAPQSGLPKYAAVRPKRSDGTASQKWEILFYPTPNDTSTLNYQYSISPPPLSDDNAFPYGGKQYAETILQSCLALAEERETKAQGPATSRFMERLAASVQVDRTTATVSEDGMWPLENEPTDLTIDLDYLKRIVGRHMGATSHPATWTHKQSEEVGEAIRAGLRRFYTPAVLPGERFAHEWSFLRPLGDLTTVSGMSTYDLPESYAFIDGPLTFDPDDSVLHTSLTIVGDHMIREYQQRQVSTGRPEVAAIRVKKDGVDSGTRYEIVLWPTPDGEYTLHYRYRTNPSLLSHGIAKPAGGVPHAQTIIEACLLSADEMLGKDVNKRYPRYIELLRTSVSHDRKANAPDTMGILRDEEGDYVWERHNTIAQVTYNGIAY